MLEAGKIVAADLHYSADVEEYSGRTDAPTISAVWSPQ